MDAHVFSTVVGLTEGEVFKALRFPNRIEPTGTGVLFDERIGYTVYLNVTTRGILELLAGERTVREVVDIMRARYPSVDQDRLYRDTLAIVRDLRGRRLVKRVKVKASG